MATQPGNVASQGDHLVQYVRQHWLQFAFAGVVAALVLIVFFNLLGAPFRPGTGGQLTIGEQCDALLAMPAPTRAALALPSAAPSISPLSSPTAPAGAAADPSPMPTSSPVVEAAREPLAGRLLLLEREMCADGRTWVERHDLDFAMSGVLLTAAPILAAGFAVFTVFGAHKWAAASSAIAALILVVHNSLALDTKAQFWRVLVVTDQNLLTDLRLGPRDDAQVERIQKEFTTLRERSAEELPQVQRPSLTLTPVVVSVVVTPTPTAPATAVATASPIPSPANPPQAPTGTAP